MRLSEINRLQLAPAVCRAIIAEERSKLVLSYDSAVRVRSTRDDTSFATLTISSPFFYILVFLLSFDNHAQGQKHECKRHTSSFTIVSDVHDYSRRSR